MNDEPRDPFPLNIIIIYAKLIYICLAKKGQETSK